MFDLSKNITYDDVVRCRLHWILCAVWRIDDIFKTYDWKPTPESLTMLIEKLNECRVMYDRLVWEIDTMSGTDYYNEVQRAIEQTPKYKELVEAMTNTSNAITEMLKRMQEQQFATLQGKLDAAVNI